MSTSDHAPRSHPLSWVEFQKAVLAFVTVLVLASIFSLIVVFVEDPFSLGRFIVEGLAYLVAIGLTLAWLGGSRNRKKSALILLIGTILALGGAYALSSGSGYPANSATIVTSYNCTTTTVTNSTGHNVQTINSCAQIVSPIQNIPAALVSNLIVWVPLVGCICFSMPLWTEGSPRYYRSARLLAGSTIGAAILMNLVGIGSSGSLQVLPPIHMPLNPFPATGECDSMTSVNGCVYTDRLYVAADYCFWLAVVVLASLATSAFLAYKRTRDVSVRSGVVYSAVFMLVLVVGLATIPAAVTQSGIILNKGNSFSFDPGNSFVNVPFMTGSNETLSGDFRSSAAVNVYVISTPQFESFDSSGAASPSSSIPLLVNATQGVFTTRVTTGSYSLLFTSRSVNTPSIEITITSALRLSA